MELNITQFFNEAGMIDYSASCAEIGQDAGEVTWQAALADAPMWNLLKTVEQKEDFRAYVRSTGGWDDAECEEFGDLTLQAMCIQFVAGWIREAFPDGTEGLTSEDWSDYYARSEQGECTGVFSVDSQGNIFAYIGN
jgi:hypothetical protein